MQRTLLFKFIFIVILLIDSSTCEQAYCDKDNNILTCSVTSTKPNVNTDLYTSSGYSSIQITYSGNVNLTLISSSACPIVIEPNDAGDNSILRILTINTNASRIDIKISLSSNQALPLFTSKSNVTAPKSTLGIKIIQRIPDAKDFQLFDTSSPSIMNFIAYELVFNGIGTNSGTLNLPNLIRPLTNIASITISGNNHSLTVNSAQMPVFNKTNRLALKNLYLHDRLLDNFMSLKEYSIQGCRYNKTAQFLQSSQNYNLSLEMRNNIPVDFSLPNGHDAFTNLTTLISLTLIEPMLNSSCLAAIRSPIIPRILLLDLGLYTSSDFAYWMTDKSTVWDLTINDIPNLNIFPSKFFNQLDAIQQVTLQGTFRLKKADICAFARFHIQSNPETPIINLQDGQSSINRDICADTYIKAINQRTTQGIFCPPRNSPDDCEEWATQVQQCDLISFENQCSGETNEPNNYFYYNGSYLYFFFENRLWQNQLTTTTTSPMGKEDSLNIGAIVGALCGLLVAVIVLGITVFCIYRYRQKRSLKHVSSKPEDKYKPSSYDSTHVSIATSKSSQSSRYALQKSFFPPIQPNDEIAPPLYTAPSESVGSVSAYRLPPAPSAPRESVLTHTTHVYETLDT